MYVYIHCNGISLSSFTISWQRNSSLIKLIIYILFSSFFLILFLLIFLPLLVLVLVPLLVSQIESRVHGGSLLSAPVLRIQISGQRGVRIKPILTNCRLLHFTLKPSPEVGDPAKRSSDIPLKCHHFHMMLPVNDWDVYVLYYCSHRVALYNTGRCKADIPNLDMLVTTLKGNGTSTVTLGRQTIIRIQ